MTLKQSFYIIQHRNDDLGENKRILLNKYSLQKKVPEVPSRARFHALMDLVGNRIQSKSYFNVKREEWIKTFMDALESFGSMDDSLEKTSYTDFYKDLFPIRSDYELF